MQNFGATNKEHYGMLWCFQEWPITSQDYKQIIRQDIVAYCWLFFFCPLQHYPNFVIRCVGNKIRIVKSCTLRRLRKKIVREHSRQNPFSLFY